MSWLNAQYRISLQLTPLDDAEVSIENARPRHLRSLSPLSFSPAGMPIKTVMGAGTAIAILQKPEAYGDLAAEMGVHGDLSFEPIWSLDDPVLERLVRLVLREADSGFVDNLLIDTLNRATALQILRRFRGTDLPVAPVGALAGNRLSRVVDYINEHIGDKLSLTQIAAIACLSPFHFTRSFKRTFGVGLHQFVVRRRIERAGQLIAGSTLSLAEIALAVGFDSQASLTAHFRRACGVTPGRYRRERA